MADGTIIIDTKIDQKGASLGTKKLQNRLDSSTRAMQKQAQAVKSLEVEYQKWADAVNDVKLAGGTVSPELQAGLDTLSSKLEDGRLKLDQLSIKAQEAEVNLRTALSPRIPRAFSDAAKGATKKMQMFKSMLDRYIMRAAVLVAVYQGIQKIKEYFGDAMKTNKQYAKAVGQLKAAFMTLAQPILQVILPAFIKMAQVLAILVTYLAKFFSMLSGKSLQASQESAKALYEQQQALDGIGTSAKKAEKSLASFDEINKLSSDSSGSTSGGTAADTIAPDFTALEDADGKLHQIAELVGAIAAGLLLWKISSSFTDGILATSKLFAGLALAIAGCYEFFIGFSDALKNGVDWENLGRMILGVTLAVTGLYLAFGSIGAGIGLIVGGLLMLDAGFTDIINNGANLQNTLLIIAGIFATGLGIFLLTGSLIPLLVAGILAVVTTILALTGNLDEFIQNIKDNILGGLIDFIKGVFTGDWQLAWDGIKKIFKGVWNGIVIILESAINLIIKGINWLIDRLNTIHFSIPDWVPVIGGNTYGINIPSVSEIQIPRLATGAVIPPNREFMAVLGDQKNGTNIETPLSTMVQAFKQAMAESDFGDMTINNITELDGEVIYRNQKKIKRRHGTVLA